MNKILVVWDNLLTIIIRIPKLNYRNLFDDSKFGLGLSHKEQIIFLKRLSMMLRAQIPIVTCLTMMAAESTSASLKVITTNLAVGVSRGQTLGSALVQYKKIFSNFCISLVTVGERSGTLPENLEYIAQELKKKQELRTQIMGALIYPVIVVIATTAITVFLVVYIFPKIVPIFLSVKTTLPWSTRFLITLSDFLGTYGLYLLGGFIVCVLMTPFLWSIPNVAYKGTRLMLRLPIIGTLCRYYNLAQITRTLGLLLQSDVPLMQALDITIRSTSNLVYKQALANIQVASATGKSLATELQETPFLFPALVVQMVRAGEKTGNMPVTLAYVSELYESDIRDLTKNLTTVIEPVLMLLMGLIVGFIAISIITPIYGITQNLHQ
jgi:type II secretory pathway component PulF